MEYSPRECDSHLTGGFFCRRELSHDEVFFAIYNVFFATLHSRQSVQSCISKVVFTVIEKLFADYMHHYDTSTNTSLKQRNSKKRTAKNDSVSEAKVDGKCVS